MNLQTPAVEECVIDIDVTDAGEFPGKLRVVVLLPGIETGVFQQHHVARLHRADGLGDLFPNAVVHKRHRPLQQLRQPDRHGPQAHGFDPLAIGTAEMAH